MNFLKDIKQEYLLGGIIQRLILWNIIIFIFSIIFFYNFSTGNFAFPKWLALSNEPKIAFVYPWSFFSYSFLHAGILHLIFNLIILNFAGNIFLTFFSEKQLLGVYLLGSFFSGICYIVTYSFILPKDNSLLVGASAGIVSLLFATTCYAPTMPIKLLLIGYVKIWHIALFILLLDILQIGLGNTGGHIAHLAGAFFGFLYAFLIKRRIDITIPIKKLLHLFNNTKSPRGKHPFKKVYKNNLSPQEKLNIILDKINQKGINSLSSKEKDFLSKYHNQYQ
ncbi:MAG: rhomboid family intramembrane serine protease [Bacteroidota bacterium]|nr:rhomboid family intramembrane serine protease [Bacteroidota bacterium]